MIHSFVEQQTLRTPDQVAVIDDTTRVTYSTLDRRSNQVAHYLQEMGVGPEVRVGVMMKRSLPMIYAIFGVLKAGGAYVPLDLRYPEERQRLIAADSGIKILLTDSNVVPVFADALLQCVNLVSEWTTVDRCSDEPPHTSLQPHNLAYVLFTSGSTGQPKGVAIEHHTAAAFVLAARSFFTPEELEGTLFGSSECFDLSIFELFVPLSCGAKLIIAENPLVLPRLKAAHEVTLVNCGPSVMTELLQSGPLPNNVIAVNLAGEPLPRALATELYETTNVKKIYNLYGPTEATTYATVALVPREGPITIGHPIEGTETYLLDEHLSLVAPGEEGDLYIGGAGLARGYLGKPGLTAAAFMPNPHSAGGKESRMYRTGDCARLLPDGSLAFLGRKDRQVKIVGIRIAPGEIEFTLDRHESVALSVVVPRTGPGGLQQLVAYFVPRRGSRADSAELLRYLRGVLPHHLVPAAVVEMQNFPRTPSGKIDLNALPDPRPLKEVAPEDVTPPRHDLDQGILKIWREVLGLSVIGIDQDFFALGGESLQVNRVAARLQSQLGITVSVAELFELRTIAAISDHLDSHGVALSRAASAAAGSSTLTHAGGAPVTFFEELLFSWAQYDEKLRAYNSHLCLLLEGNVEVDLLEQAICVIVQRHDILRATYQVHEGRVARRIAPHVDHKLARIDISNLPDQEARRRQALKLCTEESALPFNLTAGPLLRTQLITWGSGLHFFTLTAHHVIFDGWSIGLFARELSIIYTRKISGDAHGLRPLPLQYADYARRQRAALSGAHMDSLTSFWKDELTGFIPIALPADGARSEAIQLTTQVLEFTIPVALSDQLSQVSGTLVATRFMVLLAVFDILLFHLSGESDVSVVVAVAERKLPEFVSVMGVFLNLVVYRTQLAGDITFREVLQRVRETSKRALGHDELPFPALAAVLPSVRTLKIMFNYLGSAVDVTLPGLQVEKVQIPGEFFQSWDVSMHLEEMTRGLYCAIRYKAELFNRERMESFARMFQQLLDDSLNAPDMPVHALVHSITHQTAEVGTFH